MALIDLDGSGVVREMVQFDIMSDEYKVRYDTTICNDKWTYFDSFPASTLAAQNQDWLLGKRTLAGRALKEAILQWKDRNLSMQTVAPDMPHSFANPEWVK